MFQKQASLSISYATRDYLVRSDHFSFNYCNVITRQVLIAESLTEIHSDATTQHSKAEEESTTTVAFTTLLSFDNPLVILPTNSSSRKRFRDQSRVCRQSSTRPEKSFLGLWL